MMFPLILYYEIQDYEVNEKRIHVLLLSIGETTQLLFAHNKVAKPFRIRVAFFPSFVKNNRIFSQNYSLECQDFFIDIKRFVYA